MIRKTIAVSAALLAISAGTAQSASAANQLTNGSFELPGCASSCVLSTPAQANAITGWTTFLSGAEYFNMPQQISGSSAADGVNIVDLANNIYRNGGGLQQNFATTVGARYRLTFSAGNSKYAGRVGTGIIQVKVAGQSTSFETPVATSSTVVWGTVTYDFTAKSDQTTLSFWNEQDPYNYFAFIDKVSVDPL